MLHLGHTPGEVNGVTERQKQLLFPVLKSQLNGSESLILDFGCGPGRFTKSLADVIGGRAIGADPTRELLRLAPPGPEVEYCLIESGRIPLADDSVDIVWSAIVLGCITREEDLVLAAREILRVLRPGGLFFLIENTTDGKGSPHFIFRSIRRYKELFQPLPLTLRTSYEDLDETISVLTGRLPGAEGLS